MLWDLMDALCQHSGGEACTQSFYYCPLCICASKEWSAYLLIVRSGIARQLAPLSVWGFGTFSSTSWYEGHINMRNKHREVASKNYSVPHEDGKMRTGVDELHAQITSILQKAAFRSK